MKLDLNSVKKGCLYNRSQKEQIIVIVIIPVSISSRRLQKVSSIVITYRISFDCIGSDGSLVQEILVLDYRNKSYCHCCGPVCPSRTEEAKIQFIHP